MLVVHTHLTSVHSVAQGYELQLTTKDRVGVYRQLASYMKEHFGDDAMGKRKSFYFLPWHFSFFHRYRHFPQQHYLQASRTHPLIATRTSLVDPLVSWCELLSADICMCLLDNCSCLVMCNCCRYVLTEAVCKTVQCWYQAVLPVEHYAPACTAYCSNMSLEYRPSRWLRGVCCSWVSLKTPCLLLSGCYDVSMRPHTSTLLTSCGRVALMTRPCYSWTGWLLTI